MVALACTGSGSIRGQENTAGIKDQAGHRPVELLPTTRPSHDPRTPITVEISGWTYKAVKSPNPRDGVPWELIAMPVGEVPEGWHRGIGFEAANLALATGGKGDIAVQRRPLASPIPIVEVPDILWRQWFAGGMQDVVGVHFHEAVTNDVARILFTLHRIPPEEVAAPPAAGPGTAANREAAKAPEPRGVRIEATLMTPVTYCLDQSIVVRKNDKQPEAADRRAQHELGHAGVSQNVFFAVLAGPQTWNPSYCTGRRARIEYYWKREQVGRSWDEFRTGKGELATMRTTVVLVPPTRWSMMLPIPPERVTQKQLQEFNDEIVRVSQNFAALDSVAQEKFHAMHGAYERGP